MSGGGVNHGNKAGFNFVVSGSDNIMNIAGDNSNVAGATAVGPKPKAAAVKPKPKPKAPACQYSVVN